MLTACSGKSLALPEVLGGKRETVTFSDSLYRPDQEFEKISCDVREGCYAVDSEMEAGLLIGNLVRSGQREAAIVADEDLDLDKIFIYALALSPSTFEAQYTQRRMMNGTRRTIFTVTMEDEQQLQRNRVQARRIVEENVSVEMDQTETIRVLHDWLVLHTQYDEEAVALNEEERRQSLAFRASGVFERGKATCSGYMEAMDLLLEAAGIGSIRVFSNTMDHAWNLVSLDGEMRYLDATFDDPVPDQPGRVMYDFFLIEPDTLKQRGKYEFDPATPTTISQTEYEAFAELGFTPVSVLDGDCWARTKVRFLEVLQSMEIVRQAISHLPDTEINVKVKGNPSGEVISRVEQPRGECMYYVKGNGSKYLDRVRIRTPTFANIPPLLHMVKGIQLADVPVVVLSIDPCISCTER